MVELETKQPPLVDHNGEEPLTQPLVLPPLDLLVIVTAFTSSLDFHLMLILHALIHLIPLPLPPSLPGTHPVF